jgi:hypothetical protein
VHSFLRDLVCLVKWIFLQVSGAMYEMCVRGKYVAIPIRIIWYVSTNSSGSIFWIQKIFCSMMRWRFYVGMPVLTYDASAICQDPDLFLLEADLKDPVVPVCHHHTPAIGYIANRAT